MAEKVHIRNNRALGYAAGVTAGVSYGFNPLFAKNLLSDGMPVFLMLFYRYILAVLFIGVWMVFRKETFRLEKDQIPVMIALGVLFAFSSIGLFDSYNYIPAGLATTLVYLYPVFTAVLMILLRRYPSWQTSLAICMTLAGVALMCLPTEGIRLNIWGIGLAMMSALSYAIYLVIVNNSRRVGRLSSYGITFYGLLVGAVLYAGIIMVKGIDLGEGVCGARSFALLSGLALVPTMVSMLALAISTRNIGAVRTSVLGVFEPVTSIAIGFFVFSEKLSVTVLAGVLLCISAVVFMVTSDKGK